MAQDTIVGVFIDRREFLAKSGLGALTFAGLSCSSPDAERQRRKPNIILILADDLGYRDLGCYGQQLIRTPNIDSIAANGVRFTQFYSGSFVCAPSRCALMTGKHMGHASVRHNQGEGDDLAPGEVTLATVLKRAGYATACIGKWGVGYDPAPDAPATHGFDYHFGYINMWHAHNYYPEFLWRDGERVELRNRVTRPDPPHRRFPDLVGYAHDKQEYSHDLFADAALEWIGEQTGPFFLYLPLTIPHENGEARTAEERMEVPDLGAYADKPWTANEKGKAAMISRMDRDVGRILNLLTEVGTSDDTLVIFASDNGAGEHWDLFRSNGELRGGKRSYYEGGVRVPLVAQWPGRVPLGATSDHVCAFWDVLPTLAEISGAEAPFDTDGISFAPSLLGKNGQLVHEYLYWETTDPSLIQQAVRLGEWKAIRRITEGEEPEWELYDLATDESETHNVAEENPEILGRIEEIMTASHRPHQDGQS